VPLGQGAALPHALRAMPGGTLHLVATPIGNLDDVTLRALRVLREADLVLAEDTRRTRVLLDRHGIAARPRSLHAHNEESRIDEVLAALAAGHDVALVSDAGTPLVSDPGERVVAAAIAAGHPVVPVPGASAVLAALAGSGLPPVPFAFLGFPPRRAGERAARFAAWRGRPETLVLFESPNRVAATLRALAEALGERPACVARELTKLHEEWVRGPLSELAERFAAGARGEVTIVVAGGSPEEQPSRREAAAASVDERIAALVAAGRGAREIAAALARDTGVPRRELYARASAALAARRER
jgi:16S rRNA (cytidine1402-2'-O)-methyltransferase